MAAERRVTAAIHIAHEEWIVQGIELGMEKVASGLRIGEAAIDQHGSDQRLDTETFFKRESGVF